MSSLRMISPKVARAAEEEPGHPFLPDYRDLAHTAAVLGEEVETLREQRDTASREVHRLNAENDRLGEQRKAVRGYAERKAISCRALGQSDREWLDLLILLDREQCYPACLASTDPTDNRCVRCGVSDE